MEIVRPRHIPINVRRTDWRVVALATTALLLGGPLIHADDALPTGTNELRSGAEQGDPFAQRCRGIRYYAGWHKDPTRIAEAEKWFRLSAAQGNAQAEEKGGAVDRDEAKKWSDLAAQSPPSTPCYPRTELVESSAGAATGASWLHRLAFWNVVVRDGVDAYSGHQILDP